LLLIHREAPAFVEQATEQQLLVTGIKVVDLLALYRRDGKIDLFGGAGKTVRTRISMHCSKLSHNDHQIHKQFSKTYLTFTTKTPISNQFPNDPTMHRISILSNLLFFSFQENSNESRIVVKKDKDPSIDVSKYLKRA
jgi:hypothetical protein